MGCRAESSNAWYRVSEYEVARYLTSRRTCLEQEQIGYSVYLIGWEDDAPSFEVAKMWFLDAFWEGSGQTSLK